LTGDFGDEIEVGVVVQNGDGQCLGGCGNQQVWDLAASFAALGQEALDLQRTVDVSGGRVDGVERVKRKQELIPFAGVACGVADLQIADRRSSELSS
jgi:hypothetical protein